MSSDEGDRYVIKSDFPYGATCKELSRAKPMAAEGKKQNRKGRFQKRFFELRNHYLTYYEKPAKVKLLAAVDLKACTVEPEADGTVTLVFPDDSRFVFKVANLTLAAEWEEEINARKAEFRDRPAITERELKRAAARAAEASDGSDGEGRRGGRGGRGAVGERGAGERGDDGKKRGRGGGEERTPARGDAEGEGEGGGGRGGGGGAHGRGGKPPRRKPSESESDLDAPAEADKRPIWIIEFKNADPSKTAFRIQSELTTMFADGFNEEGEPDPGKALTSCRKLLGDLQERARVCHGFGANEVLYKFLIEYEKKLIMEVTNFTGETIVSKLPLQIMLGFISTVSIWYVTRTAILRDMPPALATGAPEFTLTDDINSLIDAYLDIMQPKLQDTVDRIARKVQGYTAKKDVVAMVGERLGTPGPADLFNILNEHLKLAKDGAQKVLQRRLLFDVNMNLKLYAETILSTIEERWRTAQDIYDDKDSEGVGLLCALVNDFGVGLDHMEALEATYADAIGSSITFMGDGAPGAGALDRRGSMDNAAAEDQLATRRKLMVTGNKLLEHLVAVLAVEFGPPLGKAFTDEWLMGQYVQTVMSTITDYFNDFQRWLDVYWCQHLAVLTAERVCTSYLERLFRMPVEKKKRLGTFKMELLMMEKVKQEVSVIKSAFAAVLPREPLESCMYAFTDLTDMVTADSSILLDVLVRCMMRSPCTAGHALVAFEIIITMRPDVGKQERAYMLTEAMKSAQESGSAPEPQYSTPLATYGIVEAEDVPYRMLERLFPDVRKKTEKVFATQASSRRLAVGGGDGGGGGGGGGPARAPPPPAPAAAAAAPRAAPVAESKAATPSRAAAAAATPAGGDEDGTVLSLDAFTSGAAAAPPPARPGSMRSAGGRRESEDERGARVGVGAGGGARGRDADDDGEGGGGGAAARRRKKRSGGDSESVDSLDSDASAKRKKTAAAARRRRGDDDEGGGDGGDSDDSEARRRARGRHGARAGGGAKPRRGEEDEDEGAGAAARRRGRGRDDDDDDAGGGRAAAGKGAGGKPSSSAKPARRGGAGSDDDSPSPARGATASVGAGAGGKPGAKLVRRGADSDGDEDAPPPARGAAASAGRAVPAARAATGSDDDAPPARPAAVATPAKPAAAARARPAVVDDDIRLRTPGVSSSTPTEFRAAKKPAVRAPRPRVDSDDDRDFELAPRRTGGAPADAPKGCCAVM